MMVIGPTNKFRPRAKYDKKLRPVVKSEYEALVRARLSNPKLALAGRPTIDRVVIINGNGHEHDKDLWLDYKPKPRPGDFHMPYAVITSRQWPETRFEYAFATLEESEAMAAWDIARLKQSRDWTIVGGTNNKALSKFQAPELEHLYRSLKPQAVIPEKISYNDLLNLVAHAIEYCKVDPCAPKVLEEYRRKQQPAGKVKAEVPTVAAPKREEIKMTTETETTGAPAKASKKKSAKVPKAGAKKAAKGKTPAVAKGKGAKAPKTANKAAAAPKNPLGREGTTARFMSDNIMAGKSNDAIAALLAKHKEHKAAKSIEAKHVAWQRFNLKRKGVKGVPDSE